MLRHVRSAHHRAAGDRRGLQHRLGVPAALITEQLIDFVRAAVSHAGGISPLRRIAALAELWQIRLGPHGPSDVSPIALARVRPRRAGHHRTSRSRSTWATRTLTHEVFQHSWSYADGHLHPGDEPGIGVEVDEDAGRAVPLRTRLPAGRAPPRRLHDGLVSTVTHRRPLGRARPRPPTAAAAPPRLADRDRDRAPRAGQLPPRPPGRLHRRRAGRARTGRGASSASPADPRAIADAMRAQDLRYAVRGNRARPHAGDHPRRAHRRARRRPTSRTRCVAAIATPGTAIVTLTVTEHGYTYSPRTHGLDLDAPAVQADLRGDGPPRTTHRPDRARPAAAAARPRGPDHRAQLRQPVGERRRTPAGWSASSCASPARAPSATSCCRCSTAPVTLPERDGRPHRARAPPTPTAPPRPRTSACPTPIPVPAEPFTMWVLEDRFAAGRPAWEHGGAVFTDDVAPLRAAQAAPAQRHPLADRLPRRPGRPAPPSRRPSRSPSSPTPPAACCSTSTCPRSTVPADVDLDDYVAQLFERWSNTALGHRTQPGRLRRLGQARASASPNRPCCSCGRAGCPTTSP